MRPPATPPEVRRIAAPDGCLLHARFWPVARCPVAALYLHGIQSHGGWYEHSASVLARSGLAVLMPDRRGSGRSDGVRGDAASYRVWLDDLDRLADALCEWTGARRLALIGVSWGGKLACAWTLRRAERVASLLLIAPGLFPAVGPTLRTRAAIALSLLTAPRRAFDIPLNDPALFTESAAGRDFIRRDPEKLTRATARFLFASTRLDRLLSAARARSLLPPATLLLAGRDRIIRNGATRAWIERMAAHAAHVREFPQASHTLEFDAEPGDFLDALRTWAERTLQEAQAPELRAPIAT